MSKIEHRQIDIAAWIEEAQADPVSYLQRQATDLILYAISISVPFGNKLLLKGGVLMALGSGPVKLLARSLSD